MIDTIRLILTKDDIAIHNMLELCNLELFTKIEKTVNNETILSYNTMIKETIRIFVVRSRLSIEYSLSKLLNNENITNINSNNELIKAQNIFKSLIEKYFKIDFDINIMRVTRLDFSWNTSNISVSNFENKSLTGRKKIFTVANKGKLETINLMSQDLKSRLLIYDKISETKYHIKNLKRVKEHDSEIKANFLLEKIKKLNVLTRIEKRTNVRKKIYFSNITKDWKIKEMKKELIKELKNIKECKIVSINDLYEAIIKHNSKSNTVNILEHEIFYYMLYKDKGLGFQKFYNLHLKDKGYNNKDSAYDVFRKIDKLEKKLNSDKEDNIKISNVINEIAST